MIPWSHWRLSALLAASVALVGCELAPAYAPPQVATPAAFKEDPGWSRAEPADAAPRGAWWTIFNDPALDRIEVQVTAANQSLKVAVAQYREARALSRAARADLYPTLDAAATVASGRLSRDVGNPLPNAQYDDDFPKLDLNWEIDVWGRIRDTARAAGDRARASAGDLASIDLSLHAEAAVDYFTIRGLDAQRSILDQTVDAYAKSLELTQARFKAGYAAEPDVAEAQTLLQLAKTKAADVRLQRAQLEHAIAILTGAPPAQFSLPVIALDAFPPTIAGQLPGSLLQRRPDIAAAERRVAAANAEIGVAKAAFFPTFDLGALIGTEARSPGPLFTAPAATWAVGSSGVLNLFDGGRRRAASARARASFDEASATYRQTVLTAYGEVEDNLTALRQLAGEAQTQSAAVAFAEKARSQAERRYTSGYAAYYDVVTAENIELSARLGEADIAARRMTADVLLVKALGGDWRSEPQVHHDQGAS